MTQEHVLHVRNDVQELAAFAAAVAQFGAAHAVAEKDVFDVILALDEVLTNIIWYAFEDDADHDIVVRLRLASGEIEIEVEDDGRDFDPLSVAEPDPSAPIEDRPIGGLGIYLVRRAVDSLVYRREMDKNRLTMRKRLAARE